MRAHALRTEGGRMHLGPAGRLGDVVPCLPRTTREETQVPAEREQAEGERRPAVISLGCTRPMPPAPAKLRAILEIVHTCRLSTNGLGKTILVETKVSAPLPCALAAPRWADRGPDRIAPHGRCHHREGGLSNLHISTRSRFASILFGSLGRRVAENELQVSPLGTGVVRLTLLHERAQGLKPLPLATP